MFQNKAASLSALYSEKNVICGALMFMDDEGQPNYAFNNYK